MRKVETRPSKLSVTKSPKQAAIGGAILSFHVSEAAELKISPEIILPGFKANFRQKITNVHMKEPRIKLDRHAEVIPVEATMMNLFIKCKIGRQSIHANHFLKQPTHSISPDFGFVELCGIFG